MTQGVVPAWGLLIVGAAGQAVIELAATGPLVLRIPAAALIIAVLVVNAVQTQHRRRQAAAAAAVLLLAALPLWLGHGVSVVREYDVPSMASAALSPSMVIFGTVFRHLLRVNL